MITNKKHKAFADEYLANGLNGRQAYLKAYPTSKEVSADVNASRLLSNDKVKDYLAEQQAVTSHKLQITKESLLNDLKDILTNAKEDNPNTALKTIEIINKMLGFNESEKRDINITNEVPLFGPLDNDSDNDE